MRTSKNIFAGGGIRQRFVDIIYALLMKREFVSYADVLAEYYGKDAAYYKSLKLSAVSGYGELKKAFADVLDCLLPDIEDNGVRKGGKAFRYVGRDDDPLAEERRAVVQKTVEDYVAFCKESAGLFPTGWFSSFFENTQLLLEMKRQGAGGHIASSAEQTLVNIELLPLFHKAIMMQQVVAFEYKPFTLQGEGLVFHPQFLKEYNGRWFVLGKAEGKERFPFVVPLDRIRSAVETCSTVTYLTAPEGLYQSYFQNIVGVTHEAGAQVETVIIRTHSRYQHGLLLTKPLHHSQRESLPYDDERKFGEVTLRVEPNRELTGRILTFGDALEVASPASLRSRIAEIMKKGMVIYKDE